jgi:hypothetical protein
MAPHTAPPKKPAKMARIMTAQPGQPGKLSPTRVAVSAPTIIWPSPPMLMTFARKAMQMPKPTKSRGTALTTVSARALLLPNAPSSRAP